MNNKQRAKLDSYNRVADFNVKYATDLATIPEYAAEKADFDAAHDIINNAGTVQAAKGGTSDEAIDTAKQLMAKTIVKYCLRAAVKARQAGNLTLANSLDEPETYITQAPKTTAVQRAKSLRALLNSNLATLTNITAANITEIDGTITAYDDIKDNAVEGRQASKAGGTDVLPAQYKVADAALDNMQALVVSYFESDSEIADAQRLAIEIIDTGIRHTTVIITVVATENDAPIAGATVAESMGKSYITEADGEAHIGSHRNGSFNFTISAAGRQTVNFSAKIVSGTENDFTVKLAAV